MPFHLLRRAPRLLVLAACLLLPGEVLAQAVTPAEAIAWRQDLATMRAKMEERHKDLFHHVSQGAFDADVAALDARIPACGSST
jgi:hypothetical protein